MLLCDNSDGNNGVMAPACASKQWRVAPPMLTRMAYCVASTMAGVVTYLAPPNFHYVCRANNVT